ncbi:hypothetical protein F4782DRAFT_526905 [Xylaria castorea]|nr:hypothetical protein F4782DRAFT_526905 [Xylaria castorea]
MAGALSETVETRALISGTSTVLTQGDVSYSLRPSMEMPTRDQHDYPTRSTANSSYYQSTSTTPGFSPTSLTTIVISRTATITLTTIAFITSESTITAVTPPKAPLLSSTPVNIVLSPGKIAGIVVGAIAGLLILVLLFYLLLTRAKWLTRFADYRLERKEKEYHRKKAHPPKRAKKPADNAIRSLESRKSAVDRKQTEHKRTVKARPASILVMPNQRQLVWNERCKAFESERRETMKARDDERRMGNRRRLQ